MVTLLNQIKKITVFPSVDPADGRRRVAPRIGDAEHIGEALTASSNFSARRVRLPVENGVDDGSGGGGAGYGEGVKVQAELYWGEST